MMIELTPRDGEKRSIIPAETRRSLSVRAAAALILGARAPTRSSTSSGDTGGTMACAAVASVDVPTALTPMRLRLY